MNRFAAQQVCPALYISPPDGPFHGMLEVGVLQDDERVAAAEFHGRYLEILSRPGRYAAARRDTPG